MKLKILSDEELMFLRDAADLKESKLLCGNLTILAEKAVANTQAKTTAKQIFEWGEEPCPHYGGNAMYKRQCIICWQALLKELDETLL